MHVYLDFYKPEKSNNQGESVNECPKMFVNKGAQKKKPGGKNESGKKAWWKKSLVERNPGVLKNMEKKPGVSFFFCTHQD